MKRKKVKPLTDEEDRLLQEVIAWYVHDRLMNGKLAIHCYWDVGADKCVSVKPKKRRKK